MRWDSLDRAALAGISALLLLSVAVIARGDQVGMFVTQTAPADGERDVSVRSPIRLTLSEAPDRSSLETHVSITPPVSGTWRASGHTAWWVPSTTLQPDTTYTVTLSAGAKSARGRAMLHPTQWSFHTRHPRVAYLAPASSSGYANLFVLDITNPEATPQQLTNEPYGVYDFAISPDGRFIAYSVNREAINPERDLWLIHSDGSGRRLLVQCDGHICQSPSWSYDGMLIAFQKHALVEGALGRTPGPGRIWLFDLESQQSMPLFADTQRIGGSPRFAPNDYRLAVYDSLRNAINVVDVATGDTEELPSLMGDSGAWSPDGSQIVYPELIASDAGQFSQLLRADLARSMITPLLTLAASNDTGAAWSPTGDMIAFGRQVQGSNSMGGQIWLVHVSSGEIQPLTNAPGFNYGALAWSPDGRWLVAQRFDLTKPNATPEIWLISPYNHTQRQLATDAMLPAWLP